MLRQREILHIDTEMTWRGGERQLALLVDGLGASEFACTLLAPPESAIAQALAARCKVIPQPMKGARGTFATIQHLAELLRQNQISLIHTHSGRAHTIAVAAKKIAASTIPLLVHRRVDYVPGKNPFSRWKYHSSLVDQYVCVSKAIAGILIRGGIEESRVSVVHSATDPAPFLNLDQKEIRASFAQELKLDPERPWICNASALTEQKGYPDLLDALGKLRNSNIKFHCIIAGEGPLRKKLEEQCKRLNLWDDVRFLGFINNVPSLLTACQILAVPSIFEGLGTIVQDGIHAGCAVAASTAGGIPEMIQHEVSGLLSPPGDSQALYENLKRLCLSESLRRNYATAARSHLKEKFSVAAMVAGNLAIYQRLIPAER
jgi:L-malate glycosyltransferase